MKRTDVSSRLQTWAAKKISDGKPTSQSPVDELLAEHELIGQVLRAMEVEAGNLVRGNAPRDEFWALAVEFVGNFSHLCHQVKEERHMIPALIEQGKVPDRSLHAVHREHGRERDLTLDLCNAVQDGEPKAIRTAATEFVALMQAHLDQEERFLFDLVRDLPARCQLDLQSGFARTEQEALGHKGRTYYVQLVSQMCTKTGGLWNVA
ncbi:MAG: hemerythrin domain-containing protein [Planctomycetes bacterium]|nr:hemerythrin domain-containing protein [Planctomycetota bacterium]